MNRFMLEAGGYASSRAADPGDPTYRCSGWSEFGVGYCREPDNGNYRGICIPNLDARVRFFAGCSQASGVTLKAMPIRNVDYDLYRLSVDLWGSW